jgi:hypothetical protein
MSFSSSPLTPPLFRLSYPSAVMNRQFIRHANFNEKRVKY